MSVNVASIAKTGGASESGAGAGTLILAGAPIGRPEDASPRLRAALETAGIIAAEDTRRLRRLAREIGAVPVARIVSYYDANEARRAEELLTALLAGTDVLLITDAGMPGVSDPGYRLVRAAAGAGIPMTVLPGPSAVTAALAVSGLPADRFCFEGFLPRRVAGRRSRLAELADERRTMVFFEAPHRLAAMLLAMVEAFGADRPAVACRELTKTYEEVRRGGLGELSEWARGGVRGEVTLVVAGAPPVAAADVDAGELAGEVARHETDGVPRKQAIADVARARGLAKRVVYDAVVATRNRRGG